jgi:hypothetical protein
MLLQRVFDHCYAAVGGEENPDVHYVLRERPIDVTRDACFPETAWTIMVSGIGRRSAAPLWERAIGCGFSCDYRVMASWTDDAWSQFLSRLYPEGQTRRGAMKWAAIREFAELLASALSRRLN